MNAVNNIYSELTACINSINNSRNLLLYRNSEEFIFLKEWILNTNCLFEKKEPLQKIDSLPDVVRACVKCGSVENKRPGYGTGRNKIMIILNAPAGVGRFEAEKLKDQSKALLAKMLGAIDTDLRDCYITSLIKCDAGASIGRPGLMLKNCEPILRREIIEYNPNPVIIMGDDIPVKKLINEYSNKSWYKIEHPVNLIKNPALKKSAWETLQVIEKFIKNSK